MMRQTSEFEEKSYFWAIAFFTLASPMVFFMGRRLDDNRLTSWYWVFADANWLVFFFYIFMALAVAYFLRKRCFEQQPVAFLFCASFAVAACFWGAPEVIVDSARYFTQAKYFATYGCGSFFQEWGKDLFAWTDLPLVPLIYGVIFKLFGEARVYIQIVNTLFFSGTVLLTYALGRLLWDAETGFYGGLLLMGFSYLYSQIPIMLVDVPTMFFLLLANYTYCRAMKDGGRFLIVLAALSFVLAFFAKYSTWVLLSNMAVISIVCLKNNPQAVIKRTVAVSLVIVSIIGTAMFQGYGVIKEQIDFLIEYQKPGLKRWGESYISTFLFQIHPFITVASMGSVIVAILRRDRFYVISSFLIFLLILVLQVKRIRYTLPLFPMVALMAAYSFSEIESRQVKRFFAFCIVNSAIVVALYGYLPFLKTMSISNLQKAGAFLNSLEAETIEVATVPVPGEIVNPVVAVPLLDLFTDNKIYYDFDTGPLIDLQGVSESPLRFTWEFKLPEFYRDGSDGSGLADALVVISGARDVDPLQVTSVKVGAYQKVKTFYDTSSIFIHNTFVTVYYDK